MYICLFLTNTSSVELVDRSIIQLNRNLNSK